MSEEQKNSFLQETDDSDGRMSGLMIILSIMTTVIGFVGALVYGIIALVK